MSPTAMAAIPASSLCCVDFRRNAGPAWRLPLVLDGRRRGVAVRGLGARRRFVFAIYEGVDMGGIGWVESGIATRWPQSTSETAHLLA
jgi:hypothetical protein